MKKLQIGNLQFKNPFLLAPLAGFTDKTMRTLCSEQGASLTFTEMVSGKGLKYGDRKTGQLLKLGEDEGLVGFQVFGSELDVMEFAGKTLADGTWGNVVLDLNCGCPVPKIVKNGEGSALLKDLDKMYDVVHALVKGAEAAQENPMPVTVKMRMGFKKDQNIAVEAAKAAEAAGAAAVTIHGRTREQFYEGKADWSAIASVKDALRIPVIGNGDVMCGQDAIRMMDETGCDGVMIARGAVGNPWIFNEAKSLYEAGWNSSESEAFALEILPDKPSAKDRVEMLIRHLDMLIADKGEGVAVREIRKFIGAYTKGLRRAAAIRRDLNVETNVKVIKDTLINHLVR